MKPVKTKNLEWQPLGNVYLLFDKESKKSYTLDPISFLVWLQCDGTNTIEDLVDLFATNGNRDIVKNAIENILKELKEKNLIKCD